MERMTSWARPTGMMNHHRIRGLAAAGLLCAALAGCGTAAAATAPPAPAAGGARLAATAASEVGCASVKQATSVTVVRHLIVAEPFRAVTQRHATLVRALFRDFCAALARAGTPRPAYDCATEGGILYAGAFYDGHRVLATFFYNLSGCPRLSLTASGKTRATVLLGPAAAAAPHLKADLAAVLGVPESQVYGSPARTAGLVEPGM